MTTRLVLAYGQRWRLQVWLVIYCMFYSVPSYAYIDPNTGGLIYQLVFPLIALLLGFWSAIKRIGARCFASIKKIFTKNNE